MNVDTLDDFTRGYIECALWSSHSEDSTGKGFHLDSMGIDYIAPGTIEDMVADCKKFQEQNKYLLDAADAISGEGYTSSMAGHDFWLTRNGHGAGFWDKGLHQAGDALADASKAYGCIDLYIGDDGRIYA